MILWFQTILLFYDSQLPKKMVILSACALGENILQALFLGETGEAKRTRR